MCSIYDRPAFNIFTLLGSVSNPVTLCPASAKRSASGKPTYPHPMMATLSWAPLKNSGFRSIGMSCLTLLKLFRDTQAAKPYVKSRINIAGFPATAKRQVRWFCKSGPLRLPSKTEQDSNHAPDRYSRQLKARQAFSKAADKFFAQTQPAQIFQRCSARAARR